MTRTVTALHVCVDGRPFEGFYAVQSDMLTVWNLSLGSRTTKVCNGRMAHSIDSLVREIVSDCGRHRAQDAVCRR